LLQIRDWGLVNEDKDDGILPALFWLLSGFNYINNRDLIGCQHYKAEIIKTTKGGSNRVAATSTATKAETSTAPAAQSLAILANSW